MATSPLASGASWSRVAAAYTRDLVPVFEHFAAEALTLAALPAGVPVIDVAAGPGTLAVLAARRGHPVLAVDFAEGMVRELEQRLAQLGITGVTPQVGDGMALASPDGSFGGAFSMFGLMFYPDRARGFSELFRVLRPGGRAVVSSWQPMPRAPFLALAMELLAKVAPPPGGPPPPPPLIEREACEKEMAAAGFQGVVVHEVSTTVRAPSTAAMWATFERSSAPVQVAREALGPRWPEVEAAVAAGLRERLGDGPQEMQMPAWLTVGTRA